jgi:hypothetical protein
LRDSQFQTLGLLPRDCRPARPLAFPGGMTRMVVWRISLMYTRDYLLRLLEQLAQSLARIRRQREERQLDDALDSVADAYDELLGHSAPALAMLSPESAGLLLAKGAKVQIYASLLRAEAEVLAARVATRNTAAAVALRLRALRLVLLELRRSQRSEPALLELARSLLSEVDRVALDGATLNDLRALGLVRRGLGLAAK